MLNTPIGVSFCQLNYLPKTSGTGFEKDFSTPADNVFMKTYKINNRNCVKIKCSVCKTDFYRDKSNYFKNNVERKAKIFCSQKCNATYHSNQQKLNCSQCNKKFIKTLAEIKKSKSGNHFCSQSCAGTYNNAHKKHGTRKSKLEAWLERRLPELYSNLEFHFNRKDAINSELDIYVPKLKLAFELNGVFHYEPIYGKEKLAQIENNDERKFQACLEAGIELCIIDTSAQNKFTKKSSQKYLNIITSIINKH